MAEMSLVIAVFFRTGAPALALFETDESDVKHVHDIIIPHPKINTKGLRVKVIWLLHTGLTPCERASLSWRSHSTV
jgi:hypothetical protein